MQVEGIYISMRGVRTYISLQGVGTYISVLYIAQYAIPLNDAEEGNGLGW